MKLIRLIGRIFNYNRVLDYLTRKRVEKALKEKLYFNKIGVFGEKDIVIAGYPKLGNTWFQNIISGLYFGVDLEYYNYDLVSSLSIDIHNEQYYKRYGDVVFFNSHYLPFPCYKKVGLLIGKIVMQMRNDQ
jgi:hypothetical protein